MISTENVYSLRPKSQTSSVAGPLMVGRGQLWGREDVEKDGAHLVALISVEGRPPFEVLRAPTSLNKTLYPDLFTCSRIADSLSKEVCLPRDLAVSPI